MTLRWSSLFSRCSNTTHCILGAFIIKSCFLLPRLSLRSLPLLPSSECPNTKMTHRTASEFKIKRAQASSSITDPTGSRAFTSGHGGVPELDMSSGTADEAADRALTAVGRKLDRGLSTEYTVNELIAEATDSVNLACMFIGKSQAFRDTDVDYVTFLTRA